MCNKHVWPEGNSFYEDDKMKGFSLKQKVSQFQKMGVPAAESEI